MRVRLRRLAPGETDWEFLLGVLYVPLLLAAGYLSTWIPSRMVPLCLLRRITGIPCLTCGAYRCLGLLFAGEWRAAFAMQPLVVALLAAAALGSIYALVVVIGRMPRLRVHGVPRAVRIGLVAALTGVVAANWLYLVAAGR